jgi:hypothetical protein
MEKPQQKANHSERELCTSARLNKKIRLHRTPKDPLKLHKSAKKKFDCLQKANGTATMEFLGVLRKATRGPFEGSVLQRKKEAAIEKNCIKFIEQDGTKIFMRCANEILLRNGFLPLTQAEIRTVFFEYAKKQLTNR